MEIAPVIKIKEQSVTHYTYVGRRIPKLDAVDKATGRVVYGHDVKLPRMLYGKILRSPHAHARIVHVDTSAAERLPGVKAVLTGHDLPDRRFGYGEDHYALARDKVRWIGDEVAAVAAIDEDTAAEALELIRVEYEPLPAVFDAFEAIKPGAPLVHAGRRERNLFTRYNYTHGDPDRGLDEADVVVEDRYEMPYVIHCCMETSFCLASFDLAGNLTLYSTTQIPFLMQNDLSKATGIPGSRIRVIQTAIGGGFGRGLDVYPFELIAVFLAQRTGRPVRIAFTRDEDFTGTVLRQPVVVDMKTGAKKDGTLWVRDARLMLNSGAYISWGAVTPLVMMQTVSSLYRVPHARFLAEVVYTNNPYTAAMRGYGNPQSTFFVECSMDRLAEALGMDPLEFRLRNANQPGEVTPQGARITSCGLTECLERAAEAVGWAARRAGAAASDTTKKRGVGMASTINVGGGARIYRSDGCGATVKVDDFGRVTLITGSTEIGQGSETALAQIVAEELGARLADVTVVNTDTNVKPWDVGTHASRTTFIAGNAARRAAAEAKRQVLQAAAEKWGKSPDELDMREGMVFVKGEPEEGIPFAKAVRAKHFQPGGEVIVATAWYDPPNEMLDENFYGNISATYGFGTQAAEVEVDTETGQVRVLRLVAAHDVGRAINPMYVEGQIEGGAMMGLGYALTEELLIENGRIRNPTFLDYRVPTPMDMPPIESIIVETDDPDGPFGAKGVGEMGITPTAAAIANAVYDAIGVRINSLPITPEKVLRALREKGNGGSGDNDVHVG